MKESFILYADYKEQIELLEPAEQGELLMAIMSYAAGEDPGDLSRVVAVAFSFIRARMDKDAEKYNDTVEKRRKAGEASAAKRATQSNTGEQDATQANKTQQTPTRANKQEQSATNPTDNEYVYDNDLKEKDTLTSIQKEKRFTPPTLDQVREYAEQYGREKGKPPINAERFFDFYVSKNWMIGKNKMKDWKAALRNWAREKRPARAAPFSTSRNTGYNELLTDGNW